jgi:hypothetical protein
LISAAAADAAGFSTAAANYKLILIAAAVAEGNFLCCCNLFVSPRRHEGHKGKAEIFESAELCNF